MQRMHRAAINLACIISAAIGLVLADNSDSPTQCTTCNTPNNVSLNSVSGYTTLEVAQIGQPTKATQPTQPTQPTHVEQTHSSKGETLMAVNDGTVLDLSAPSGDDNVDTQPNLWDAVNRIVQIDNYRADSLNTDDTTFSEVIAAAVAAAVVDSASSKDASSSVSDQKYFRTTSQSHKAQNETPAAPSTLDSSIDKLNVKNSNHCSTESASNSDSQTKVIDTVISDDGTCASCGTTTPEYKQEKQGSPKDNIESIPEKEEEREDDSGESKTPNASNGAEDSDPHTHQSIPLSHQRDTKALKDRFNYASGDCAAVVLKTNREAKGATAILNSKKDQYMLNKCSAASKFAIVELCDDILIDTVVLGNYEFFSSTFKDVIVSVSDRYPPKNNTWTMLGHFQARNNRDAQVFPVSDPKIWTRYIKVDFISHYGNEFYCPVTTLRIYGATQMEKYRKEEEEEGELFETATLTVDNFRPQRIDYPFNLPYRPHQLAIDGAVTSPAKAYLRDIQGLIDVYSARATDNEPDMKSTAFPIPRVPDLPWGMPRGAGGGSHANGRDTLATEYEDSGDDDDDEEYEECYEGDDCIYEDETVAGPEEPVSKKTVTMTGSGSNTAEYQQNEEVQSVNNEKNTDSDAKPSNMHPQPQQESIFKTIMRRLMRVERNVTLAYHYLEEQHMIFNLVMQQVQMHNLESLQMAVQKLNHTTAKQMQALTTLSEEVWRAILYDLEEYQQVTRSDMDKMANRLEFLAEEVLFEKRMNVTQLILLISIIIVVAVNKMTARLTVMPEAKKKKKK